MDYVELHKRRQYTSGDRVVLDGGLIGIVGTITYDHGDAAIDQSSEQAPQ